MRIPSDDNERSAKWCSGEMNRDANSTSTEVRDSGSLSDASASAGRGKGGLPLDGDEMSAKRCSRVGDEKRNGNTDGKEVTRGGNFPYRALQTLEHEAEGGLRQTVSSIDVR